MSIIWRVGFAALPDRPPRSARPLCCPALSYSNFARLRSSLLTATGGAHRSEDRRPAAPPLSRADHGMGAFLRSSSDLHMGLRVCIASPCMTLKRFRIIRRQLRTFRRTQCHLRMARNVPRTETDEADALGVLWHGSFEPARLRSYPQYRTKLILASGSAPALCGMCAGSMWSGRVQPRLRRSNKVRRHTAPWG